MKLDQFKKGELEKLTNDLNKLCDEQGRMWQKYKAINFMEEMVYGR